MSELTDIQTVTSENHAQFVQDKLAPTVADAQPEVKEEVKAEPVEEKVEEPESKEPPKEKNSFQERISELTAKRKAAEAERDATKAELDALRAAQKPIEVKDPTAKPDPKDYTDAFQYAEDLSEWKVNNTLAARDKEAQEKSRAESAASQKATWLARQNEFKTTASDYSEVLEAATVGVSDPVRDAIYESDLGPQLLYYLAKNQDEATRIGKLTTVTGQLREIGKLEAKLWSAEKPQIKSEPSKAEVSKAPEPINPLKGGNGAVESSDGDNLSYEQYKAKRQAGKIH